MAADANNHSDDGNNGATMMVRLKIPSKHSPSVKIPGEVHTGMDSQLKRHAGLKLEHMSSQTKTITVHELFSTH